MTLDPRLLDLLVCPACHGEIRPVVQPEGLECLGCRRVYPVRDGIPVMLVDEATSRPESDPGSGSRPAAGS